MSTVEYRILAPQDRLPIKSLIEDVMTEFNCVGEGYSIEDPELADLPVHFDRDGYRYFVAIEDGKVIAGSGIAPLKEREDICELQKMYMRPESRGQGIGRALMKRCLDFAKEAGYTQCYLETTQQMHQAAKLYKACGFKETLRTGATGHCGCDRFFIKDL